MKHVKTIFFSLALVFLVVVLSGAGCSTTTSDADKNTNAAATNTNAATAGSKWTTSTSRQNIPDAAISGTINDKAVTIAEAQITKWDEYYGWSFSDTAADETCGLVMEDSEVVFDSKDLKAGTFTKELDEEVPFEDYYAYYVYNQEDGSPMSVNAGWSATVIVNKIDEANKTVTGWAKFEFDDGHSAIEGSFTADLCE